MEPDVTEIPLPPPSWLKNKGKAVEDNADVYNPIMMMREILCPPKSSVPGSHIGVVSDSFSAKDTHSGRAMNHSFAIASQLHKLPPFYNGPLHAREYTASPMNSIGGKSDPITPSYLAKLDNIMAHSIFDYQSKSDSSANYYGKLWNIARSPRNVNEDDVMRKYQTFKQFDTVEDHADHHFARKGSSVMQPPKNWAKRILEEWRILEKDLPDNIYVRVYESRMDLLRAVIIGAEGTPYHDGLFFFDVFFPSDYLNVPPNVYYHSGGLQLKPNLYSSRKVCLSLLCTWHGSENEKWQPRVSTALQVLVSIQALILNQKPYFNEHGFERTKGLPVGKRNSQEYNEDTFTLSLKTMVYALRRQPKVVLERF